MATSDGRPKALLVAPRAESTAPGRPGGGRPAHALLAYVLHSYDWSETSLIVELFTRERGRVVVAAKGAKRPTSNFRPVLLPFQPLHALLGKAAADEQAEVLNLRSAEWVGGQALLPAGTLLAAYYLNELLLKMLARQDPHVGLFDAYAQTLAALAAGAEETTVLRTFELMLLRELGLLPDLSMATLNAQPLLPQARYTLQAEVGLVPAAQGIRGTQWVAFEAALSIGSTAALQHACGGETTALRAPLRELLHYHLGTSKLRTRQVWRSVQQLAASACQQPTNPP
jgi:DNA repair protein RecO (recombination protein O)